MSWLGNNSKNSTAKEKLEKRPTTFNPTLEISPGKLILVLIHLTIIMMNGLITDSFRLPLMYTV
jgi:hypothetical protein